MSQLYTRHAHAPAWVPVAVSGAAQKPTPSLFIRASTTARASTTTHNIHDNNNEDDDDDADVQETTMLMVTEWKRDEPNEPFN